jgi:chromosomal replication initiator protein
MEDIQFKVDKDIDNPSNTNVIDCVEFHKKNVGKTLRKTVDEKDIVHKEKNKTINDRYTLDKFIVGADSQLAYSAAEAVVKNPGSAYNPLYIYGEV